MRIELNIGLEAANGDNGMKARSDRAAVAFVALAGWATFDRRAQSNTEDTLIMVCHVPSEELAVFNETIFALAQAIRQDCIAVYYVTGWAGELIGPNAAAWGAFNPDFFIRYEPNDGPAKIFTKAPESKAQYTGHGAATGGLQGHSMGDEYPYLIIGVADRWEAPTEYSVMDTRTGNRSPRYPTYQRAYIELTSLKIRNCMHS